MTMVEAQPHALMYPKSRWNHLSCYAHIDRMVILSFHFWENLMQSKKIWGYVFSVFGSK